jgi:hypothetical protein
MKKKCLEFILGINDTYKLNYKNYELLVSKLGDSSGQIIKIYVLHEDEVNNYDKTLPFIQSRIKKFLNSISSDMMKEKLVNDYISKPMWRHLHEMLIEFI